MANIPFSPAAQQMRRTGKLLWGLALVVLAILFLPFSGADGGADFVLSGLLAIVGGPLLFVGIRAEQRARAFNREDMAIANSISHELTGLVNASPAAAFDGDEQSWEVPFGTVVELQRHFDRDTAGSLLGTLDHRLSMFTRSFGVGVAQARSSVLLAGGVSGTRGFMSGVSNVDVTMSSTTRDNLMGDALFSVLEVPSRNGTNDTMRVISMSQPGAASWIANLVTNVGNGLGARSTHAGATVLNFVTPLTGHFAPRDISYATDRLMALERRSRISGDAPGIAAFGEPIGRNAMLATRLRFDDGQVTSLFPARFPAILGRSIGAATTAAIQQLEVEKGNQKSIGA
jgi:hypothetical protein